ncbi:fimbrial protein [Paraburkholderia sediminicola]|uniref:fimbrial protein n=1 Tax=Paraburkholderia sediminicola TaxID=458836 RepID=UPI0038B863CF
MKFASGLANKLSRFVVADRQGMGRLGLLLTCLALLLVGPEAHADCSPKARLPDTVVKFPTTIYVPPDAANGAVLATTGAVAVTGATANTQYASCSGSGSLYWQIAAAPVVANRTGTTSVAGIGYTISLSGGGFSSDLNMDTQLNAANVPGGLATPKFTSQLYVTVNLVKTGPITPGKLSLNPSGTGTPGRAGVFFAGDGGSIVFTVTMPSNVSSVSSAACTVTTLSPNVSLDAISTSALKGVDSTAGEKSFPIKLNCPSAETKVYITLTDNANPANTSTTLSLKSGSTASGVGLQVLNAGTPVAFGPDSAAPGNKNQWLVGTSSEGPMTIPLTARYVQTATKVKAGTVNGVATFTMSYQ